MGNVSKILVNGFMRFHDHLSDFSKDLIKNCNENSDEGYFLKVDIENQKQLFGSQKELPFSSERKK